MSAVETTGPITVPERTHGRPAWPYALTRAIDRLPIPNAVVYVAVAGILTVALELRFWVGGSAPPGSDTNSLTFAFAVTANLWFFGYLQRGARAAFERFRPALAQGADADRIRTELSELSPRAGLVALGLSILLTTYRYAFDPASSSVAGLPLWVAGIAYVVEVLNVGLLFTLVAQLIRQTAAIRRVLAQDTVVDIYRAGPLHALSGLSARMGIYLVVLTTIITVLVSPDTSGQLDVLTLLPFVVVPVAIALVAFLLPLYGTHDRLVDEKQRLQGQADTRLQGLVTEINELIDGRRLGEVDPLNKALIAVVQQRDMVSKLSTWPWSTGTGRALATAILLPVALFVAQRAVGGVLGLH